MFELVDFEIILLFLHKLFSSISISLAIVNFFVGIHIVYQYVDTKIIIKFAFARCLLQIMPPLLNTLYIFPYDMSKISSYARKSNSSFKFKISYIYNIYI